MLEERVVARGVCCWLGPCAPSSPGTQSLHTRNSESICSCQLLEAPRPALKSIRLTETPSSKGYRGAAYGSVFGNDNKAWSWEMWYHFSLRNENNEPQSLRFLLIKTPRGIGGTVMAAQDKRTDFFLWVYKVWLQEDSFHSGIWKSHGTNTCTTDMCSFNSVNLVPILIQTLY